MLSMKQTILLHILIVCQFFCSAVTTTETAESNVGKRYPAEKQVIADQDTERPCLWRTLLRPMEVLLEMSIKILTHPTVSLEQTDT